MGARTSLFAVGISLAELTILGWAYSTDNQLPSSSAISFERLLSLQGLELPEIDIPSAEGERRRLDLPDMYYDQCVFWINSVRSREGLPALQRWRDFEDCSDKGARFDARQNKFHESFTRGMHCDWKNYYPVAQNTCPHWFIDGDTLESCTTAMWRERDLLQIEVGVDNTRRRLGATEIVCKNGRPGDQCAGHYFNLRGGSEGYNAYDRVACGFYVQGSTIWINQNFGSGKKTDPQALAVPELFQPYGFACGGDESTRPAKLLSSEECGAMADPFQYDDCRGEYRRDYRWHGCVSWTCDERYSGPCVDFTFNRNNGNLLPNGSGEEICSDNFEAPCAKPYAINFPKGSRVWHKTREVCRKTCGTCACQSKPFDNGFRSLDSESDEGDVIVQNPPSDDGHISEAPPTVEDNSPVTDDEQPEDTEEGSTPGQPALPTDEECLARGGRRSCISAVGCQWTRDRVCVAFDGVCGGFARGVCVKSGGCTWNNDARPRVCESA